MFINVVLRNYKCIFLFLAISKAIWIGQQNLFHFRILLFFFGCFVFVLEYLIFFRMLYILFCIGSFVSYININPFMDDMPCVAVLAIFIHLFICVTVMMKMIPVV